MFNNNLPITTYRQQGAALFVSMVILIILTILVLGSMRNVGMNNKMLNNTQILSTFQNTVDGEAFGQMAVFAAGGKVADEKIAKTLAEKAGYAYNLARVTNQSYTNFDLDANLYALTKKAVEGEFINEKIYGRMCTGYGVRTGCENMLLKVDGEVDNVAKSTQTLGFGVVAPAAEGLQGIKNVPKS